MHKWFSFLLLLDKVLVSYTTRTFRGQMTSNNLLVYLLVFQTYIKRKKKSENKKQKLLHTEQFIKEKSDKK